MIGVITVAASEAEGLAGKWHEGIFWCGENNLCLSWGGGYLSQNSGS